MTHTRLAVSATAAVALLATGLAAAKPAADAPTVRHVLNRITFGPRPGDVERVQQMGLERYIDEQLHPERRPDTGVDRRLDDFETLRLDSRTIATTSWPCASRSRTRLQPMCRWRRSRARVSCRLATHPGTSIQPAARRESGLATRGQMGADRAHGGRDQARPWGRARGGHSGAS